MRTTITMDDHLLDKLKARAASRGSTVSRLVEDAVRLLLSEPADGTPPPFEVVTFGAGGRFTGYDVDRTPDLLAADDVARYGGSGKPGGDRTRE